MKLAALSSLADVPTGAGDLEAASIALDSRRVERGALFAALPGTKADGLAFAADAVRAGAIAVLAGEGAPGTIEGAPVLRAAEPREALAKAAALFHGRQPESIVAVTGTAGKTSVASFVRQIWEGMGIAAAMIGTTGVEAPSLPQEGRASYGSLTTPDAVTLHALLAELAADGVTACAMEASSHGLDQHRLSGVAIRVGGFTNLGRDHMDYHPTVEHYLASKMKLFERLTADGQAVVNADDAYSAAVIDHVRTLGVPLHTVGRAGEALRLLRVEQEQFRQIAEVEHEGAIHRVPVPLAGEFQLSNALVAAQMATLGVDGDIGDALAALEHLRGASGRLELVGRSAEGAPAYVDYAHKPEALENMLRALKPYTTGRLHLVFGCGGDRDPGKRAIMGEIAARLADRVIVTDDNPRSEEPAAIRAAIMTACPGAEEIGDRRAAIAAAVGSLGRGDTLVVAGKGHEEGQTVGDETLPFSDHAVLREALGTGAGTPKG